MRNSFISYLDKICLVSMI